MYPPVCILTRVRFLTCGHTGRSCVTHNSQVGNGRLNYINGYVAKDHDAVDVGLGEYVQKASTAPWLASFRLLSKGTPCIPEVAIRMASLPEFDRTYSHVLLYPPQAKDCRRKCGRVAAACMCRLLCILGFCRGEGGGDACCSPLLTRMRTLSNDVESQNLQGSKKSGAPWPSVVAFAVHCRRNV